MTAKEVVNAWYKNIDAKNFKGNQNLLDPGHQFSNPMTPTPLNAEEHLGMMQDMTAALDGTHIVDVIVEEQGWVAVSGRWKGKHVGDFNGVAATGNDVEFSFSDFLEVRNGKIREERLEMNPMSIMAQIGAVPA